MPFARKDCVLDIASLQRAPPPLKVSIPSFEHDSENEPDSTIPRRTFGSASTSDSDPFSEVLPWTALFESKIWSPTKEAFPSDALSSFSSKPTDIDLESVMTEGIHVEPEAAPSWLPSILDPTTLAFEFDHSCLYGLDDVLLQAPKDAFAAQCWEAAVTVPNAASKNTTIVISEPKHELDRDSLASSPVYRNSSISVATSGTNPIPVFLAPSLWSEDSDEEEESSSDEDLSYDDDCYSNGTITGAHLELEEKEQLSYWHYDPNGSTDDVKQRDSLDFFEYHYSLARSDYDRSKGVGHFPTPVIRRNKTVSGRFAAFCAGIPTRLTLVRSGTLNVTR